MTQTTSVADLPLLHDSPPHVRITALGATQPTPKAVQHRVVLELPSYQTGSKLVMTTRATTRTQGPRHGTVVDGVALGDEVVDTLLGAEVVHIVAVRPHIEPRLHFVQVG